LVSISCLVGYRDERNDSRGVDTTLLSADAGLVAVAWVIGIDLERSPVALRSKRNCAPEWLHMRTASGWTG
jgi:hypothetical protein